MDLGLRKVQMTVGGTYFVSLPKDWSLRNGVKKGSIIATSTTQDDRLLLDPKYDLEPNLATITIKPSQFLEREIIGNYLLGYDVIKLKTKDNIGLDIRERIKSTSSRLIGLEIIEENYSTIVMQCLLEASTFTPDKILRREHSIVSGMYRDTTRALIKTDTQLAKSIIARDNEVDRLYFLLVRFLRRLIQNPSLSDKLNISPIDCLDYRLAAIFVELVGDISTQIANYILERTSNNLTQNISDTISTLNEKIYFYFQDALESFLSRDMALAENVRNRRKDVESTYSELITLANKQPVGLAKTIHSVSSLIIRVYNHSVDISDLTVPRITKNSSNTFARKPNSNRSAKIC